MNGLVSAVFFVFFCFLFAGGFAQPGSGVQSDVSVPDTAELEANQPGNDSEATSPFVVTGTISGPTGPAENITVHLEVRYTSQRYPSVFLDAQTDSQGFFQLDLGPYEAPEYALEFYTTSYRYQLSRHFKKIRRVELPYTLNMTLALGVVAQGVVVDEEGNPIADVAVSGNDLLTVKTNPKGMFEITGLATNYHALNFMKEGYSEGLFVVEKPEPGIMPGIKVVLTAAGKLTGTVTDWLGRPVVGAQVIYQEEGSFKEAQTTEAGGYEFTGVSRKKPVALVVQSGAGPVKTSEVPLEVESFDVQLDGAAYVVGKVFLEEKLPGASALIVLYDGTTNEFLGQGEANGKGEFRVGPLALGSAVRYEVKPPQLKQDFGIADVAIKKDAVSGAVTGEITRFDDSYQSTLTLLIQGETLQMTRVDSGNGGFPGEIQYQGSKQPDGGFKGDLLIQALGQTGTFELLPRSLTQDMISGDWVLREKFLVQKKCFSPVTGEVVLSSFPGDFYITEALVPGTTISGTALDDKGLPIQEGMVLLQKWNKNPNFREMAEIKLDGKFEFTCVPEGDFEIIAYSRDGSVETNPFFARSNSKDLILSAQEVAPDDVVEFTLPE